MANINFSVDGVRRFREGIDNASNELDSIKRETDSKVGDVMFKAEKIKYHVEGVLNVMSQDRQTASDVRSHNKSALERMKHRLAELERHGAELSRACADAKEQQKAAESAASSISSISSRSTGDSKADAQMAKMREKLLADARSAARENSKRVSDIQAAQHTNDENIQKLRRLIEETERLIKELDKFIQEINEAMEHVDKYLNDLIEDKNALQSEIYPYSSASHQCNMCLRNCSEYADKAIKYGRDIANSLFPGEASKYDGSFMMFTDHTALGQLATNLRYIANDCNVLESSLKEQASIHSDTLQDNLTRAATREVNDFCSTYQKSVEKLQASALACEKADKSLRAYYDLHDKNP